MLNVCWIKLHFPLFFPLNTTDHKAIVSCRFFIIRENYMPNEYSINSIQVKSKPDWYLQIYSKLEFSIYYI